MATPPPPPSSPISPSKPLFIAIIAIFLASNHVKSQAPVEISQWSWCVTRGDASNQALQRALDYACSSGADCTPLMSNGLCYLPNTLAAHASYAFNSFYQRKSRAPGSCDFGGTAAVARTDPSYGSCVYPHQLSNAGGGPATSGTSTDPTIQVTPAAATTNTPVVGTGSTPAGLLPPLTTPDIDSTSHASNLESLIVTSILISFIFCLSEFLM